MLHLSENDFRHLEDALLECREMTLVRTMDGVTVTARTVQAQSPWRVAMIIEIVAESRSCISRQLFESAQSAKRSFRGWRL